MVEIISCPVCWGKKVVCVGLKNNLEPITQLCSGCDGTGWIAYKTVEVTSFQRKLHPSDVMNEAPELLGKTK